MYLPDKQTLHHAGHSRDGCEQKRQWLVGCDEVQIGRSSRALHTGVRPHQVIARTGCCTHAGHASSGRNPVTATGLDRQILRLVHVVIFPRMAGYFGLREGITDELASIVVCLGITGGRYSNARYHGRGRAGSGSLSARIGTTSWDQASIFDIRSSNLESFGYRGTCDGGQNTTVLVVRSNRPTPITFSYVCWMNRDILSSISF